MKKIWILFSQTVTVLLAVWFVVATLQPNWLRSANSPQKVSFTQAILDGNAGASPGGSFRQAAQKASPAVVSITVQQKSRAKARRADPWFRFFEEPEEESNGGGMGRPLTKVMPPCCPKPVTLPNQWAARGHERLPVM
jgi:S1-C subfamily serine protease